MTVVSDADNIEVELIKLANGARLLRFTDPKSGLTVERKLDPTASVSGQKDALAKVFQAAVAQANLTVA